MVFVNTSLEDADVVLYMVDSSKEDLKDVTFLEKIHSLDMVMYHL